jgi:hypothetical protein
MAEVSVVEIEPGVYAVSVTESRSSSSHRVSASPQTIDALGAGRAAEDVVAASFRFLLDREPKESILASFDLPVIGRYFPEYEQVLPSYLGDA